MDTYSRLLSKTASAPEVNMEDASAAYYDWLGENAPNFENEVSAAELNAHFTNEFLPVYMANKTAADQEWAEKTAEAEQMGEIIGTRAAQIIEGMFDKLADGPRLEYSPAHQDAQRVRSNARRIVDGTFVGPRSPHDRASVAAETRRRAARAASASERSRAPGTLRGLAQDLIPGGRGAAHYDQIHSNVRNSVERAGEYIKSRPGAAMETLKANKGKALGAAALIGAGGYAAHRMSKKSSDEEFEIAVGEQLNAYAEILTNGGLIDTGTPAVDQWDYDVKNTALAIMAEDGII